MAKHPKLWQCDIVDAEGATTFPFETRAAAIAFGRQELETAKHLKIPRLPTYRVYKLDTDVVLEMAAL